MAEVKRYMTPVFRLSFPHLFTAHGYDGGEPKFSCSAVWTPGEFSDKEKGLWNTILKGMDVESMNRFKKHFKDLPANIKRGIRDGAEKADMEGYGKNTKFANLTTKMRPGVVNLEKDTIGPEEGNDDEIYPGCYCRATVTIYSYDKKGKGIALGLMNIQKVRDGERLDSRTDAAEDFENSDDFLEDDTTAEFLD